MTAKKFCSLVLCPFLLLALICSTGYATDLVLNDVPVKVLFSPNGGCTQAIIDEINGAQREVLVQAYLLTSASIAKALVFAHKRAVKVEVLLDKSKMPANRATATFLANFGIPIFIDGAHTTAHDKVMIIDGQTVITGSYNFTKQAEEKNAENLIIVRSEEMAKLYRDNWEAHRPHSEEYAPRY